MKFHADNPAVLERLREANLTIRFAMQRSPEEYYETLERPSLAKLVNRAALLTGAEFSHEYNRESEASDLFLAGISDIIPPIKAVFTTNPDLKKEHALKVVRDEQTIATYGLLASMAQERLYEINIRASEHFRLSDDHAAIIPTRPLIPSPSRGCEAVNAHHNTVEMTPMFKKFVAWSGSLAVLSFYEHLGDGR